MCGSHFPLAVSVGQAEKLLDRGLHPVRVAEGFEKACEIAVKHLETIADTVSFSRENVEPLYDTAMTTLSSKIINIHKSKMARIAVDAVLAVADLERKDVNFDMIKVEGKPGGRLEVRTYCTCRYKVPCLVFR